MRLLLVFVPMIIVGQGIVVSPSSPTAFAGQTITISTDRPVTFSLTGAGTLADTTANSTTYTAPSTLSQTHVMAGCMVLPADSVYNTRIDDLPVAGNSPIWVVNGLLNGLGLGEQWGINVIDHTVPLAPQVFHYTPAWNGYTYPVLQLGSRWREGGSYTTDGKNDHHVLTVNHETCRFYETYQDGLPISSCPTCTAASGWAYNATTYQQPNTVYNGGTTDAAGLPLAPLTVHLDELEAGVIKHALRLSSCAGCIAHTPIWPAVGSTGGGGASSPPMGARFRLKSSFNISGYPPAAQTVLTALKQYGMMLADIGTSGQLTLSADVTRDPIITGQLNTLLGLSGSNFEVVDESSLMLSSALNTVNPNNPYVQPMNSAVLTLTDAANPANVERLPIALQPVTVGTPEPALAVQAGSAPFQISAWVNGSSTTDLIWSISPSTGVGTLGDDGTYTAPASITSLKRATISITSAVDPNATTSIALTLFPAGPIRIDTASSNNTVDSNGNTWLADFGYQTGSFSNQDDSYWWRTVSPPQTSFQTQYYTYRYTWGDDMLYSLHVPNGSYNITLMFGLGDGWGTYSSTTPFDNGLINGPFDLEVQGQIAMTNFDYGALVSYTSRTPTSVTLPATVNDTNLRVAIRTMTNNAGNTSIALLNALMIVPVAESGTPAISVSTSGLTFASVQIGSSASQSIVIGNTGTATLRLQSFTPSGDFAIASNTCSANLNLAPNAQCQITLSFTPAGIGTRTGSLTITSTAPGSPTVVPLSGTGSGTPAISVSPSGLTFASIQIGSSASQSIVLGNTGTATLTLQSFMPSGDFAIVSNTCSANLSLAPNAQCQITLSFTPAAIGTRTGSLTITSTAPGSPIVVPLNGTGSGTSAISVSPSRLTFASIQIGSSASQSIVLGNTGTATLTLQSFTPSGDFAIVSNTCSANLSLAPNAQCQITLSFTPAAIGTRTGSLTITSTAPGSPIVVPLSGTAGGTPAISISPSSELNLGTVPVGNTTRAQVITISNTGSAPLSVQSVVVPSPFAVTSSCAIINPGTACNATVAFTASQIGTVSANIMISTTAGSATVPLSASGSNSERSYYSTAPVRAQSLPSETVDGTIIPSNSAVTRTPTTSYKLPVTIGIDSGLGSAPPPLAQSICVGCLLPSPLQPTYPVSESPASVESDIAAISTTSASVDPTPSLYCAVHCDPLLHFDLGLQMPSAVGSQNLPEIVASLSLPHVSQAAKTTDSHIGRPRCAKSADSKKACKVKDKMNSFAKTASLRVRARNEANSAPATPVGRSSNL